MTSLRRGVLALLGAAAWLAGFPGPGVAQEPESGHRFSVELEGGPAWQTRNDVQIPNDASGTRFALDDLTGSGPFAAFRLYAEARLGKRNVVRLLVAPLSIEGTGALSDTTQFNGSTFVPGVPTTASYRFDSYRLTWAYRLIVKPDWDLALGLTGKIRSAEIGLAQNGVASSYDDLGFVPLLHVYAAWRPAPGWALALDADGAAASQGRAFDVSLKLRRDLSSRWSVAGGYRTVEGGADVEDVYTFAWFQYAVLSVEYRF
jgi:hypothetical protein